MDEPKPRRRPVGRPPAGAGSPDQTREAVLRVAEALLQERGYAATSMQAVAAAGGITKGTLYHHFPAGKDALVAEVGRRLLQRNSAGMVAAATGHASAEHKLVAMAAWLLTHSGRSERMLRDAVRFLAPSLREEMNAGFLAHVYRHVEDVLAAGIASGELPPHDSAFAAWSYLGLVSEFGENAELRADARLPRQLVALVLRGLPGVPPRG